MTDDVNEPDVSVIVPVYNTMPYLTACLSSVVDQSIGRDNMEVIVVDDGSTDGSGEEIERFVSKYPSLVRPVHQENSGGPAGPCNRGLEIATGRYVFFLGADDYLGHEAMERLVRAADEGGSDIVLGRMVGANGRNVWQTIFAKSVQDLDFYSSSLPYAVSNTKLFRRSLVEKYGLRYPEDLSVGSDQPFTIEAMIRARRISVLADYTYYYAVRRDDSSNISFSTTLRDRLRCITAVMDFVADLLPSGPKRDAVLERHFSWEISKLLAEDFLTLDAAQQHQLCDGIRHVCDLYLTDRISASLPVPARVRLELARRTELDRLQQLIEHLGSVSVPPYVIKGADAYLDLPGLHDASSPVPITSYAIRGRVQATRLADKTELTKVRWDRGHLVLEGTVGITVLAGNVGVRVAMQRVRPPGRDVGPHRYRVGEEPEALERNAIVHNADGRIAFEVRLDATRELRRPGAGRAERWLLTLRLDIADRTYDIPLGSVLPRRTTRVRHGLGFTRMTVRPNDPVGLVLVRKRLRISALVRAGVRRVTRKARRA